MLKNVRSIRLPKINRLIGIFHVLVYFICFTGCKQTFTPENIRVSEDLQLTKLNDHSYIHISYYTLKNGVKFPCNGFVYSYNKEAYIFDSPATDQATIQLINWIQDSLKAKINGVVFNHFHDDCTKGNEIFKENNIRTIANKTTRDFMILDGLSEPDQVFDQHLELNLGNQKIINSFFGEAHTKDNIISYFPEEKIIFGGCLVKSLNATKGNLADANESAWSGTITNIKRTYPDAEIIIPGHGSYGDQSLLDYTITLFNIED